MLRLRGAGDDFPAPKYEGTGIHHFLSQFWFGETWNLQRQKRSLRIRLAIAKSVSSDDRGNDSDLDAACFDMFSGRTVLCTTLHSLQRI
jgi:hypothetical protein